MLQYSVKVINEDQSAALKLKYTRGEQTGHELAGLFNYMPVIGPELSAAMADPSDKAAVATFRNNVLLPELAKQGITEGKWRLKPKWHATEHAQPRRDEARLAGSIDSVAINHASMDPNESPDPKANTMEPMRWVVKAQGLHAGETLLAGVKAEIPRCFDVLKEGRALEVVNAGIREVLTTQGSESGEENYTYKLRVHRPDLKTLKGARVVIGESGQVGNMSPPVKAVRPMAACGGLGHYEAFTTPAPLPRADAGANASLAAPGSGL